MDGRRINSRSKKYNPLFILFLCMIAAVVVLLVVSIVLGAELGKANKKLDAAQTEITTLEQTVAQLESDLAAAQQHVSGDAAQTVPKTVETKPDDSAGKGSEPVKTETAAPSSWLDLSGHSEVKVKPSKLLDGYAAYYATANVNVRGGPGTSYDRITVIERGEKVQVAARENGWSFAKIGGKFGWINSDYLSVTQPAPLPATATKEATSGNLQTN